MRVINLILALLWLVTAIVLAVVAVMITMGEGEKSPQVYFQLSGAAFILAIYNIVRWWSIRAVQTQRPVGEPLMSRRRLYRPGDDVIVPDPNFNFTDSPAAEPPPSKGPGPEQK